MAARRFRGEDSISFDHRGPCTDQERHRHCPGRWRGQVSLGFDANGRRVRKTITASTKTALASKLKALHDDLDTGVTNRTRTLKQAVDDWLAEGLDGRSPKTIKRNTNLFYATDASGSISLRPEFIASFKIKLRELNASHVRRALIAAAETRSTGTVSLIHNCLTRAIRHAEARDLVRRNVAMLVDTPRGRAHGRPSESLTLEQVAAVIAAAESLPEVKLHPGLKDTRRPAELMYCYIILSVLIGVRTEEARALLWSNVHTDDDVAHAEVWRSVRERGETKTRKSRRTLGLPQLAVDALRAWHKAQVAERLAAGPNWGDTGLVFTTATGAALDSVHVRKMFKKVTKNAGIGEGWTPRELRHTFVSLLSERDVPIERIADMVGHASTRTTETVYLHQLRPVIQTAADVMDEMFPRQASD